MIEALAEGSASATEASSDPDQTRAQPERLTEQDVVALLERRLGRTYARQRLGLERDHETRMSGGGPNLFQVENWYLAPWLIRGALRLTGLHRRARHNAERIVIRENLVRSYDVPASFHGFSILHITDMHIDISPGAMRRLMHVLPELDYDLCVLTGDYRGKTYGPFQATLDGLAQLRPYLKGPVYGVLGNHDTAEMVPVLERIGIRMLVNESKTIAHRDGAVCLAGIDDAHFYRMDNLEKAVSGIPDGAFSILLSHTPEIYRYEIAAHDGRPSYDAPR